MALKNFKCTLWFKEVKKGQNFDRFWASLLKEHILSYFLIFFFLWQFAIFFYMKPISVIFHGDFTHEELRVEIQFDLLLLLNFFNVVFCKNILHGIIQIVSHINETT